MRNQSLGLYICLLLIVSSYHLRAQNTSPLLKISEEVNVGRYDRIQGSPYYYDDWQKGSVLASNGQVYENVALNFNGDSHELELKEDDRVRQLILGGYIKVTIPQDTYSDVFIRGINPKFGMDLVCVSYNGQKIKLVRNFQIRKEKYHTTTTTTQKFLPTVDYYLVINGQIEGISIRKKKIIKILGHEKEAEAFLTQNNNPVKSEKDLIQLLNYYDAELLK